MNAMMHVAPVAHPGGGLALPACSPSPTNGTARWRNQPIVPKDYEDIANLIKVAREARHRIVEFDLERSSEKDSGRYALRQGAATLAHEIIARCGLGPRPAEN
jgi:hypothetical protein